MAIKLDEDNNVVVYENEPDEPRSLFPNLQEGGGGSVEDVQINGTSILNNGVANVPIAGDNILGVVKADVYENNYSGGVASIDGKLYIVGSPLLYIKQGVDYTKPIVAGNQNQAVFYGLAKAAGDTSQSNSSNPVGQYTENAKNAIKTMLGISDYYERVTPLYIVWDSESSSYMVYSPQGVTLDIPSINPILRLITAEGDNATNFVEFSLIKSETTDPDYETTFDPVTVLTFRSLEPTWFNKIVTITYVWYLPFEECTISVTTLS